MKLAVTPSCRNYVLLIVDTETDDVQPILASRDQWSNQLKSEKGPYWRRFGIAWTREHLLVAARHNVLYFDQNLEYLFKIPDVLGPNPHQIVHYNDELYVANASKNTVSAFDAAWNERVVYDMAIHAHFNSLLIGDDFFWVNASCRGPSHAVELYSDTKKLTGTHSHNLGFWAGELASLDTNGTGWLTTGNRSCEFATSNDFCRGLAISEDQIFVGVSHRSGSDHNYNTPCHIQVLDPFGRKEKKIDLGEVGPIHDIRLLDTFDHAHLREPFL